MDAVYEFRVAGEIGPVIRSAVPELTTQTARPSWILSGSLTNRNDVAQLLEQLDELHLVDTEITIRRSKDQPPHA